MSAFVLTSAIGTLLGIGTNFLSWVLGGIFIIATTTAALLTFGLNMETYAMAGISIIGYNFGLMLAVFSALQDTEIA